MIQSLAVNNIYVGEGSDSTGVVTKMLTVNGSLRISVYNPATFFGIHVSSSPISLVYSEITVATGQVIILSMFDIMIIEVRKNEIGRIVNYLESNWPIKVIEHGT